MKVLELRGYKSYKALQAFHTLMLGLKMLPSYAGEKYEDFYARLDEMPEADQEKLVREAALFVPLDQVELEALLCFATDKNGVPYSKENLGALGPKDLHEVIVAVAMEISRIKIDLVSESEKKSPALVS